jgi:hypothetical protein
MKLHPEFGLNPTMTVCFWCGKPDNNIALLGNAYKKEAPKYLCVNADPCDVCATTQALGITFAEVSHDGAGPTINKDGEKLTGRWATVAEKSVINWIAPGETLNKILQDRKAFITPEVFAKIVKPTDTETDDTSIH